MSATDCILGPLARSARERGEVVEVWWWPWSHRYEARVGSVGAEGRTAQEACDDLERWLAELEKKVKIV